MKAVSKKKKGQHVRHRSEMAQYNATEGDQPRNINVNSQMFHHESQNVSESGVTSVPDLASGNTTHSKYDD